MEYDKVFMAITVVAASIFGILSMLNFYNDSYDMNVGSTFNSTMNRVAVINNITKITADASGSTQTIEGSGPSSAQTSLIQSSLSFIKILPQLIGLVPDMIYAGADMIGIPDTYQSLAVGVFVFAFVLLFAYLLLIGAKAVI